LYTSWLLANDDDKASKSLCGGVASGHFESRVKTMTYHPASATKVIGNWTRNQNTGNAAY
jgi:hypothetical protein